MASVPVRVSDRQPVAIARVIASRDLDRAVAEVLGARGLVAAAMSLDEIEIDSDPPICALAPAEPLTPSRAAELASLCRRLAELNRPMVVLTGSADELDPLERAATHAYLRSHGAILHADPDAWLESLVLLATIGMPQGRRVAVVARPHTWLWASAGALAGELELAGRSHVLHDTADDLGPTDAVLIDAATEADAVTGNSRALLVPVVARSEQLSDQLCLVGLRPALAAVRSAGAFAERRGAGFAAAAPLVAGDLKIDRERLARQLGKLRARAGDHETKVLLTAFGVPVTRQAVATTPSAAIRLAKRVGFPVEMKPWGPEVPSERDGCPVERDIHTAADVRRAYAAVTRPSDDEAAVIVREPPRPGRSLRVLIEAVGELGLSVMVDADGSPRPAAAPAPLRRFDAEDLAGSVEASRMGDAEPDRAALADLLLRASHLVASESRITSLELSRVIVHPRGSGAVVVDAHCQLRDE